MGENIDQTAGDRRVVGAFRHRFNGRLAVDDDDLRAFGPGVGRCLVNRFGRYMCQLDADNDLKRPVALDKFPVAP